MITGSVDPWRQAVVHLVVRGPQGQEATLEVLVDTGYEGPLTLPAARIAALGLRLRRVRRVMVADGSLVDVPVHEGRILWNGEERPVMIRALGDQPLPGIALLLGCRLQVDVVDGGVTVEPLK